MSPVTGPPPGSPTHQLLVGAWVKVERAKTHRLALADEILAFNQVSPGRLEGTYNSSSGLHVIRIVSVPDYPVARWGVVVGDVVHNLRSALDHLAWQMANLHGPPGTPWRVHFPIVETWTNFRRALLDMGWLTKRCGKEIEK